MKKQKCPICKGSGEIEVPYNLRSGLSLDDKSRIAKILRNSSFSLREIGRMIDVPSPSGVKGLIDRPAVEKKRKNARS